MRTVFKLIRGDFEVYSNMDGWIITSEEAEAKGNPDLIMLKGDRIDHHGDVWRDFGTWSESIGNIAL